MGLTKASRSLGGKIAQNTARLRHRMLQAVDPDDVKEVIEVLHALATGKDPCVSHTDMISASKVYLEYVLGKPKMNADDGNGGRDVNFTFVVNHDPAKIAEQVIQDEGLVKRVASDIVDAEVVVSKPAD